MKSIFLFLLLFCFNSLTIGQGNVDGFFKPKGELDVALSSSFGNSTRYFTGNNLIAYDRNQLILSAYANYGLSNRFNLIISLPVINFTFQDAAVFAKLKLVQKNISKGEISLFPSVGITFPTHKYETESGQSIGQRATVLQPKLIAQYKSNKGWFLQGQMGYNYSFFPVPSSIAASCKIGYIYKQWYFDLWYDYQYGIGGRDYASGLGGPLNSFRDLGVSYNRIGGVVYKNIGDKWGLFLNGSLIYNGRNISELFVLGGGVVLKFKVKSKQV